MKHYYFLIIQMSILFCVSCAPENDENHHYYIIFNNNTGKDLYVIDSSIYPDTTNGPGGKIFGNQGFCKVEAYRSSSEPLHYLWESYEEAFILDEYGKRYPSDTMMVFVYDVETFDKITRHDRVKDSLLLQEAFRARYDLSLQDLQRLNWTLSYPPTENMKTIKMWPNFFQ